MILCQSFINEFTYIFIELFISSSFLLTFLLMVCSFWNEITCSFCLSVVVFGAWGIVKLDGAHDDCPFNLKCSTYEHRIFHITLPTTAWITRLFFESRDFPAEISTIVRYIYFFHFCASRVREQCVSRKSSKVCNVQFSKKKKYHNLLIGFFRWFLKHKNNI